MTLLLFASFIGLMVIGVPVRSYAMEPEAPCCCGKRFPIDWFNWARAWSTRAPAIWSRNFFSHS